MDLGGKTFEVRKGTVPVDHSFRTTPELVGALVKVNHKLIQ